MKNAVREENLFATHQIPGKNSSTDFGLCRCFSCRRIFHAKIRRLILDAFKNPELN